MEHFKVNFVALNWLISLSRFVAILTSLKYVCKLSEKGVLEILLMPKTVPSSTIEGSIKKGRYGSAEALSI